MRMIWATRGHKWGFRFLEHAGIDDPLGVYEQAFDGFEGECEVFRRRRGVVALRFSDPDGRCDSSGRVIPHDFVLLGPKRVISEIDSVDAGRNLVWPKVAEFFADVWLDGDPPDTAR
mgnify:CR=1 FL=1